jgi:hypothetical protein
VDLNQRQTTLAPLRKAEALAHIAARVVFLPVESIWLAAGRWVTPDPRKRFSESDFDSGNPSILACSQRTRGRGKDQSRP